MEPTWWEEWVLWFIRELGQHWLRHALWLAVVGVGAMLGVLMFGRRYKQRIAALESQIEEMRKPTPQMPIKARLRHRSHLGWWTRYPGTNREVDVMIPEVWIEYEDGSTMPLELEGLHQGAHGIDIYPLGPIAFGKPPEDQ